MTRILQTKVKTIQHSDFFFFFMIMIYVTSVTLVDNGATLGPFTLVKTTVFKFAVFCLTIYTCPKNRELSAGTKLRDFLDRYCACPNISYFSFDWECLQLCVCVCVCVCLTQMSSFSNFDIIVLDWGAYKCVCVCVSNTSVIAYWVKYNSPRLGPVPAVACVSNIYVLV